jgi:hypothetical protein
MEKQTAKQPSSQAAKQPSSQAAKQPSSQAAKQPSSQAAKQPSSRPRRSSLLSSQNPRRRGCAFLTGSFSFRTTIGVPVGLPRRLEAVLNPARVAGSLIVVGRVISIGRSGSGGRDWLARRSARIRKRPPSTRAPGCTSKRAACKLPDQIDPADITTIGAAASLVCTRPSTKMPIPARMTSHVSLPVLRTMIAPQVSMRP